MWGSSPLPTLLFIFPGGNGPQPPRLPFQHLPPALSLVRRRKEPGVGLETHMFVLLRYWWPSVPFMRMAGVSGEYRESSQAQEPLLF